MNGELTMGENIADLAGLAMAYRAYQLSLNGKAAPVIDGFTGDQRFFIGWAQGWARKYRDDELRRRLLTDPHSPSEYRTNIIVVRTCRSSSSAFDVKPGDKMYRAPAGSREESGSRRQSSRRPDGTLSADFRTPFGRPRARSRPPLRVPSIASNAEGPGHARIAYLPSCAASSLFGGCGYNTLQQQDEQVTAAWSEVLNQYQRRADLVPNLVNTVKGAVAAEKDILDSVDRGARQGDVDPGDAGADQRSAGVPAVAGGAGRAELGAVAADGRGRALSRSQVDLRLQRSAAQLEGTENRIAVARKRYIEPCRPTTSRCARSPPT